MEYIRTHEHRSLNKTQDMKAQPGAVIASLWKYIDDPHEGVRSKTAGMAAAICEQEDNDAAVRQEAVELLLTAIDNEPIPHLAQMAAVRMMSLPPSLFSRRARDIIHRMMSRDRVESEIIRMAGLANVQTP
jgi:hypothetical protein